jgi:uncharacterized phage protein gp47/JayE
VARLEALPTIFTDNEDDVRAELLGSVPARLAVTDVSWARDLVEICTLAIVRTRSEMNLLLAYTFPQFAFGAILDAHAESVGIQRGTGRAAVGRVRFTGTPGAVIGPTTIVEAPVNDPDAERVRFQTTNTSGAAIPAAGYLDVDIVAIDVGDNFNVGQDAIKLLDTPITGITGVTNPLATFGGEGPEDDESLREKVMDEAELPTGGGTKLDYRRMGTDEPGVGTAAVEAFWDTAAVVPGTGNANGSVRISLRDANRAPVDWQAVESAQRRIDPSRQQIALLESGEPWTVSGGSGTLSWNGLTAMIGSSGLRITNPAAGTTSAELTQAMDLSRFNGDTDMFEVWLKANDWSRINPTSEVRFYSPGGGYFSAFLSAGISAKPTTVTTEWWPFRLLKRAMSAVGNPSWDSITSVRFYLTTTAAANITLDHWRIMMSDTRTGEGQAPIGHRVTVVTPVSKAITVTANVLLDAGYTLSGATGTTDATDLVRQRLAAFLLDLEPGDPVRLKDIENVIHDTPGVLDFAAVNVNGTTTNVPVSLGEHATLAAITLGPLA